MKKRLFLVFVGILFFFNPCFNMFDILPDFLGAALIIAGLSPIVWFDGNFEAAKKNAGYLVWISAAKLLLCMWCTGGHKDYLLPFSFAFAVLEAIFMTAMFKSLYKGAEYTLLRSGSELSSVGISEGVTMSCIFTFASRFLDFAPQICEIYSQNAELDLSHKASYKMSMAQMKTYVSGFCLVMGLVLGIIFVVVTAKTWTALIWDNRYGAFLKEKYENFIKTDREVYVTGKISLFYVIFSASALFFYDFYIDAVNVIPTIIGVVCLALGAEVLCSLEKIKPQRQIFVAAAVCTVLSGIFMQNVHKGISYVSMSAYSNEEQFSLLADKNAMTLGVALCLASAILTFGIFSVVLNYMKITFINEKRSGVAAEIIILRCLSALSAIFLFAKRALTCAVGRMATVPYVTDYIKNKAFITSGKVYEQMISNPDVVKYERLVGFSTAAGVALLLTLGAMLFTAASMSRKTEGDKAERRG